jgi:hypothetical protein
MPLDSIKVSHCHKTAGSCCHTTPSLQHVDQFSEPYNQVLQLCSTWNSIHGVHVTISTWSTELLLQVMADRAYLQVSIGCALEQLKVKALAGFVAGPEPVHPAKLEMTISACRVCHWLGKVLHARPITSVHTGLDCTCCHDLV